MEIRRRTWTAAVKLAAVLSVLAAAIAYGVARAGDVPEAAVIIPVIVVGFTASWLQTGRIRRRAIADTAMIPART